MAFAVRSCLSRSWSVGSRSYICLLLATLPSKAYTEDSEVLTKAVRFDGDGRLAFMQNKFDESKAAFHSALKLLDAELDAELGAASGPQLGSLDARSANVVASARVHLGVVAHKQGDWEQSVQFFEAAHQVPGTAAFDFLRMRPWPYSEEQLPDTLRWFARLYASGLHRADRDGEARTLWEGAANAGVTKDKWQCSLKQSPAEWGLRLRAWWKLSDVKVAHKLATVLKRQHSEIKEEAFNAMVHRKVPSGAQLELKPEMEALRSGRWLELILFKNAEEAPRACAALPQLCEVLRPFRKVFHSTSGEVKLSHFIGGTVGRPHCGPVDSKLRMHFTVALPQHRLAQLTVAGKSKTWNESKSILFDDSMEHSVVFDADVDANRIILIVDFWHPDVPSAARRKTEL